MPITLPPSSITRRDTLKHLATAGAGWFVSSRMAFSAGAEEKTDRSRWLLCSDTHVAEDVKLESRGGCMAKRLEQAVREMLDGTDGKPFGLLHGGDCAFDNGQPGDYATLSALMQPLREAGIPLHFAMGNHDHRENFLAGCATLDAELMNEKKPVAQKHVAVVEGALVTWLVMDSLDQTDVTPGKLGEAQLGWVDRTLRDLPERPVIAFVHHNPQVPVEPGKTKGGLLDSDALLALFEKHRKVKALVFGHTHNWSVKTDAATGLHLINLPPVGYAHRPDRPVGWVAASVHRAGIDLTLHSLDTSHPEHGQQHELKWRV